MTGRRELLVHGGPGRFVVAWNPDKQYIEVFYLEREGGKKMEPGMASSEHAAWVKRAIEEVKSEMKETPPPESESDTVPGYYTAGGQPIDSP